MDARRGYDHAINEFVVWYRFEPRLAFDRTVVLHHWSHLKSRPVGEATSPCLDCSITRPVHFRVRMLIHRQKHRNNGSSKPFRAQVNTTTGTASTSGLVAVSFSLSAALAASAADPRSRVLAHRSPVRWPEQLHSELGSFGVNRTPACAG